MDATPAPPRDLDGVPLPRRAFAVLTIVLGVTMAVVDASIVNVALPKLARDLGVTAVTSIWVVNAYQLAVVVALLPMAALGDRFGYKPVYWSGLGCFTLASLGCALAPSFEALVVARAVQGLSASAILSVNTALIRFIYPRRILGQGLGFNTLTVACSSAAGPSIASAILSLGSWHWLFAVNLPVGLVALAAGAALPDTVRSETKFDFTGALLNALTFGTLIFSIDALGHGQRPAVVLALFAAVLLFGAALIRQQLGKPTPLLPVDLLRVPIIALSLAAQVCASAVIALSSVSLPFYFVEHLGRTQVQTGWLMTPWPLTTALVAPLAGRLSDRVPAGLLGGAGLAVLAFGLAMMTLLPAGAGFADIAWRVALCGLGMGLFQTPNSRIVIAAAPLARSGAAAGVSAMARNQGMATGAALVALIFGLGLTPVHALALGAGLAAAAAVLSTLRLGLPPAASV